MRNGSGLRACLLALAMLTVAPFSGLGAAQAQIGSDRYAAIVLDARTGTVLAAASPDETRHPASLTKMMTLYMVFEALREGRVRLDSRVTFSEEAAARPPSKLGIPPGISISVEQAILALVTRSANDVAAAVGERLGETEPRFAQMMTMRARSLGMSRTTFRNASGLPDPDQVTTARDMATLGMRLLRDFPNRYHYFGVSHAEFGAVRIRNHNRMLESYEGVDGIKTGYIRDSGFNIVTSATRGGQRLVGAVFGGSSWVERDAHMAVLLDQGFDRLGVTARGPGGPGVLRSAQAAPLPGAGARQAPPARQAAATQPGGRAQSSAAPATARQASTRAVPGSQATRQPAPTTRSAGSRTATATPVAAPSTRAATAPPRATTRTATAAARGAPPPTTSAARSSATSR